MQPAHSEKFRHFPIMSCSCDERYQALPAFPYCMRWKARRGLGTRVDECHCLENATFWLDVTPAVLSTSTMTALLVQGKEHNIVTSIFLKQDRISCTKNKVEKRVCFIWAFSPRAIETELPVNIISHSIWAGHTVQR